MAVRRDQRVAVLVDVQNLFYAAKHVLGGRIHYERLLSHVLAGRRLVRAICYVVRDPEVEMSSFLNALRNSGYEIRVKTSRKRQDGSTRGDWGVGIALDAMALAARVDTIILVSGNGDLAPVLQRLRALGAHTEVFGVEQSTAQDLREMADRFEPISSSMLYPKSSSEPCSREPKEDSD